MVMYRNLPNALGSDQAFAACNCSNELYSGKPGIIGPNSFGNTLLTFV
jgi:hypothetical protein